MVADHKRRHRRTGWAPVMFLGPFGVLFALFFLLPIGYAVYESLLRVQVSGLGLGPSATRFVGLANYAQAFSGACSGSSSSCPTASPGSAPRSSGPSSTCPALWSIANIVTWEYTGYNMLIISPW